MLDVVAGHASGITATACVVAELDASGTTRLPVLSSRVPLVLRRTPDAVYLVGGAAGPLGGDDLTLTLDVRDGATLRVRTAAAAVALPGPDGGESVLRVRAAVGPGARLEYLPEQTVVADNARHRIDLHVTLAADAALLLRDEIILGRHGERGGSCVTRLRVDHDGASGAGCAGGAPLLRHEMQASGTDEVSLGPAVLAGNRAFGSLLVAGPGDHPVASCVHGAAVMPLGEHATLVTALAPDAFALRRLLDGWLPP